MDIKPFLQLLIQRNGSDLFFTTGAPVKIKVDGLIHSIGKTELSEDAVKKAVEGIMDERQRSKFEENWELDFAISMPEEHARFRVNAFRQRGEVAMVLRLIPNKIPGLESLGLPPVLKQLVMNKRGLILMVGATGSGKSTTLASMVAYRNQCLDGHILTIEDPIEYSHPNIKSIVNQREVGVDTKSYHAALRSAMREAPDVILVGEIRDRETMQSAIELANTGHLCLTTLHANNANQAMERIINLFPHEYHRQLLMDLSLNIKAIISQRLVHGIQNRRIPAVEVLMNTPYIADLIEKGHISEIKEAMEDSGVKGMQTFDTSLYNLYEDSRIHLDEALNNADSRTNLEAKINFG